MSAPVQPSPGEARERELAQEQHRLLQQAWAVDVQLEELTQSRDILRGRLKAIDAEMNGLRLGRQPAPAPAPATAD